MSLTPHARARRVRVRAVASVIILTAWVVALGGLVKRDVLKTDSQKLSDLALRVNPGNVFFAVEQDGRHIGWASSTIDTLPDTLVVTDALVADLPVGTTRQRTTLRSQVVLSRGLVLRSFTTEAGLAATPTRVRGRVENDSSIAYVVESGGVVGDTQRVRVPGPVLMPTLVPLVAILGGKPRIGRRVQYETFDPATLTARAVALDVQAESLFVVDDSARMDARTGRWVVALHDTVRAWRLGSTDSLNFSGWVDAQGRVVATTELTRLRLTRQAYELAFENWRLDNADSARDSTARRGGAMHLSSAIQARVRPSGELAVMRVRLSARSLKGMDLRGARQSLDGDVLTIQRERPGQLTAAYTLPPGPAHRARFANELRAEPNIEVHVPFITAQAVRSAGRDLTDARAIVANIVQWVHDSIAPRTVYPNPTAVTVLQQRAGDCDQHALLFTALARTMGIPTRIATGFLYVDRQFYYHSWPEVYLGDWVAVDPTFGQFPADASHVRLFAEGLSRRSEFLKLQSALHIEVLEAR